MCEPGWHNSFSHPTSPRRAALLTQIGIEFTVKARDIDETRLPGESVEDMVRRLALSKAAAAARGETLPVLGADTAVVIDDALLGKPADRVEGLADACRCCLGAPTRC